MPTVRTQATMTTDRANLDEVVGIFKTFIAGVKANDPGTLTYHYFVDDGDPVTITVFEEYTDSAAHLEHYAKLDMSGVGRLLELVTLSEPNYYGTPSPEERELLKGFGNVHYHAPLITLED